MNSGNPHLWGEVCCAWQPGFACVYQSAIPLAHTLAIFRARSTPTLASRGHQLDSSDSTGWLSNSCWSLGH